MNRFFINRMYSKSGFTYYEVRFRILFFLSILVWRRNDLGQSEPCLYDTEDAALDFIQRFKDSRAPIRRAVFNFNSYVKLALIVLLVIVGIFGFKVAHAQDSPVQLQGTVEAIPFHYTPDTMFVTFAVARPGEGVRPWNGFILGDSAFIYRRKTVWFKTVVSIEPIPITWARFGYILCPAGLDPSQRKRPVRTLKNPWQ